MLTKVFFVVKRYRRRWMLGDICVQYEEEDINRDLQTKEDSFNGAFNIDNEGTQYTYDPVGSTINDVLQQLRKIPRTQYAIRQIEEIFN